MRNTDPEAIKSARAADPELMFGLSFFALLWVIIGAAIYQALPVIGCLSAFSTDNKDICMRALERSYIPATFVQQLREKLVEALMASESHDEALAQIAEQEKLGPINSALLLQQAKSGS